MRVLTLVLPICVAFAGLVALTPTAAKAATSSPVAITSMPDTNIEAVAGGCGPRYHRVWRRGRSWCVRNRY